MMLGDTGSFPYLGAAGRSSDDSDRYRGSGGSLSALGVSIAALCLSTLLAAVVVYNRYAPQTGSSSCVPRNYNRDSVLDETQQVEQLQASVNPLRNSGNNKYAYAKI